jgi:Pyruvate/2-oxoacid:ferredoxin oxidoreductase delta subunit
MNAMRKVIEIDEAKCTGCGECATACAEGAIEIVDAKARLISDTYCDGLGACLGDCPEDALKIVRREAGEFDEQAVEVHLAAMAEAECDHLECGCPSTQVQFLGSAEERLAATSEADGDHLECGCPSTQVQCLDSAGHGEEDCGCGHQDSDASELSHWPVQIRLVPPNAPFLKGADLLVASDCVPVAYRRFHQDFLSDKVVLMGCPKLDDAEAHVERLAEILAANDIKSVTTTIMEVPCCVKMTQIVSNAVERSGKQIPVEEVVIGLRGEVYRKGAGHPERRGMEIAH